MLWVAALLPDRGGLPYSFKKLQRPQQRRTSREASYDKCIVMFSYHIHIHTHTLHCPVVL